jgi:urease accessory protein
VWSATATAWEIEPRDSVLAYLWTWAENQVLVAMKAVPIGQTAGQRVLLAMGSRIAEAAAELWRDGGGTDGMGTDGSGNSGDEYSNFSPGLAILSAQHETQYSRLFRS